MSAANGLAASEVFVNGHPCRVWRQGRGERIGYLAGFGGLPRWTPFLDALAAHREVVAPSLPGFPGGLGHGDLDSHLDWLVATHELLSQAGLAGCDLIGASVGGALAADVAAVWPKFVKRLVLIGPLGLCDPAEPMADLWAQRPGALPGLLCADPDAYLSLTAPPDGHDELEWQIETTRAAEAAARLLWPIGDTRLAKRLGRIDRPTLLLWGEGDRVVPQPYAERFAGAIAGPTTSATIAGAGHLADLDQPAAVAKAIERFLG